MSMSAGHNKNIIAQPTPLGKTGAPSVMSI
jgi:hypothetical protein